MGLALGTQVVGISVGRADVGNLVGIREGSGDGIRDGLMDGISEGDDDGTALGIRVG